MKTPSLKESLVCTFSSSREAFTFENAALAFGLSGRLIPTPPEVRSDCGLSWMSEPTEQESILQLIKKEQLSCHLQIVKIIRC